jgi:hypothetical protein
MSDKLTALETTVYRVISYFALVVCGVCIFFVYRVNREFSLWVLNGIGFFSFVLMGVFGLGVKHDVRVLDLRKFDKLIKVTEKDN